MVCALEERKNKIFLKMFDREGFCFENNETFPLGQNCKTDETSIIREILSYERAVADAINTFCTIIFTNFEIL